MTQKTKNSDPLNIDTALVALCDRVSAVLKSGSLDKQIFALDDIFQSLVVLAIRPMTMTIKPF
jgi:hypothetical protein